MSDVNATDESGMTNAQREKLRVFAEIRDIGRVEGKGKTARMMCIEKVVRESKDGPIAVEDAGDIWKNLMQGAGETQLDVGGADPKDTAQRTSDLKHFIVLGNNKNLDGPEVIDNAKQRMRMLRSSGAVKNARIWEMMLTFARAQNKSPEHALTDDQIDKLFEDRAKRERELADKLWTHRAGLIKANEGEDRPDVYQVCEALEKIVQELGGTSKQKKAARLAAKKAAEDAAKNGTTSAAGTVKRKGARNQPRV